MHIKNRRWLRFAALLTAHYGSGLTATGNKLAAVDPAGSYEVSGVGRDGSHYEGSLVIAKLAGEALYRLEWNYGARGTFAGTGALVANTLYVVWAARGISSYVVVYEIEPRRALHGIWVSATEQAPATGTEIAVPESGAPLHGVAGDYTVTGSRFNGSSYERRLKISQLNGYYRFLWEGDERYEGIGTVEEDLIQAVVSPAGQNAGQCGKAVIELSPDDTFAATWMTHDEGFRLLGSERGVRL